MSLPDLNHFPIEYTGQVGRPGQIRVVIYGEEIIMDKGLGVHDDLIEISDYFKSTSQTPRPVAEVAKFYQPYRKKIKTGETRTLFKKVSRYDTRTILYGDLLSQFSSRADDNPWSEEEAFYVGYGVVERGLSRWFDRKKESDEQRSVHLLGRVALPSSVYSQYRELTYRDRFWPRNLSDIFTSIMKATVVPDYGKINEAQRQNESGLLLIDESGKSTILA